MGRANYNPGNFGLRKLAGFIASITCLLSLSGFSTGVYSDELQSPDEPRQRALIHLLKQDCGSCHGMTLNGGLGPALTPQSLQNKPDEFLIVAILKGRTENAMPPWEGILSRSEVVWLVSIMKAGVPE